MPHFMKSIRFRLVRIRDENDSLSYYIQTKNFFGWFYLYNQDYTTPWYGGQREVWTFPTEEDAIEYLISSSGYYREQLELTQHQTIERR